MSKLVDVNLILPGRNLEETTTLLLQAVVLETKCCQIIPPDTNSYGINETTRIINLFTIQSLIHCLLHAHFKMALVYYDHGSHNLSTRSIIKKCKKKVMNDGHQISIHIRFSFIFLYMFLFSFLFLYFVSFCQINTQGQWWFRFFK